MIKESITKQLQALEEIPGVTVQVSGYTQGTIRVIHTKHHAPEFIFKWSNEHFVGYFIDGNDAQSQAVVSLYTALDAVKFISAYAMLNEIRANQKS